MNFLALITAGCKRRMACSHTRTIVERDDVRADAFAEPCRRVRHTAGYSETSDSDREYHAE
jgi:hypothetical protein